MTYFFITVALSNAILVLACLIKINVHRHLPQSARRLRYFLLFLLFTEIISKLLIYVFWVDTTNNLFKLFVAFEFLLLTNFAAAAHPQTKRIKTVTILLFVGMLSIYSIDILWHPIHWTKFMKSVSNILIITYISRNLLQRLQHGFEQPNLLIVYYALLFYYFVSTILFLIMDQLQLIHIENAAALWAVNNFLSIILYATCTYYLYSLPRSR